MSWKVPDHLMDKPGDFIIYGEPLFAEAVADQLGLLLLEPPIAWLTSIPRELKSRNVIMKTLSEVRLDTWPQFVKPADGKIFDPKVYQNGADLPTEAHVDELDSSSVFRDYGLSSRSPLFCPSAKGFDAEPLLEGRCSCGAG